MFAGALEWPGWCRSGRGEDGALEALLAYARRYRSAMGRSAEGLDAPKSPDGFEVVERLRGDATTDFGAPGAQPEADRRPLDDAELGRLTRLLPATWRAFDRSAQRAEGVRLRKGPRGGGRELPAIVAHVLEADRAYLSRLGGRHGKNERADLEAEMAAVRRGLVDAIAARTRGDPLPEGRRSRTVWTPRYGVRRSAWHALDHAWEIEDRVTD